jgi:hypothetical protein
VIFESGSQCPNCGRLDISLKINAGSPKRLQSYDHTTAGKADPGESRRADSSLNTGHSGHVDNDFATALACSMNNFANGPGARFFRVRMAIA